MIKIRGPTCLCVGVLLPLSGFSLHRIQLPPEVPWPDQGSRHTSWPQTCSKQTVYLIWAVVPQQSLGHAVPGYVQTDCIDLSDTCDILMFATLICSCAGNYVSGERPAELIQRTILTLCTQVRRRRSFPPSFLPCLCDEIWDKEIISIINICWLLSLPVSEQLLQPHRWHFKSKISLTIYEKLESNLFSVGLSI